jgi:hypothetical protein
MIVVTRVLLVLASVSVYSNNVVCSWFDHQFESVRTGSGQSLRRMEANDNA